MQQLCNYAAFMYFQGLITFRCVSHVVVIQRAPQTILNDAISHLKMPHPASEPLLGIIIRGLRHTFHPTRNYDVGLAEQNGLCAEHNRLHAGAANLKK